MRNKKIKDLFLRTSRKCYLFHSRKSRTADKRCANKLEIFKRTVLSTFGRELRFLPALSKFQLRRCSNCFKIVGIMFINNLSLSEEKLDNKSEVTEAKNSGTRTASPQSTYSTSSSFLLKLHVYKLMVS